MDRKDLGQPLDVKEVISRLAQPGYSIRTYNNGEYDGYSIYVERIERMEITRRELDMLIKDGWVERPFASGWYLSDEGRKTWLRSTDELGDGKLRSPASGEVKL
jgi:hypothetical protein